MCRPYGAEANPEPRFSIDMSLLRSLLRPRLRWRRDSVLITRMNARRLSLVWLASFALARNGFGASDDQPRFTNNINVVVPRISTDTLVKYDYDIVYVRALRAGDKIHKRFYTDFSQPVTM